MRFEIIVWCHLATLSLAWPHFFFYPRGTKLMFNLKPSQSIVNHTTGFDPNAESIFLVHGFNADGFNYRMQVIKRELLKHTKANVFIVDWYGGTAAKKYLELFYYGRACKNAKTAGYRMADYIANNHLNPKKVTCLGYSLGSHVCGFAGKKLNGRLGRISAIDPAGPLFKFQLPSQRLAHTDAKLVDCIYTTWFIGIMDPICKLNFYFNLDFNQPQCSYFDLFCSHLQGVYYYSHTIRDGHNCHFKAARCDSATAYRFNHCPCSSHKNCIQAGFHANKYAQYSGKFYLQTSPHAPFCRN